MRTTTTALFAAIGQCYATALGSSHGAEGASDVRRGNENHIFNAVHGALRAWDSAVNHNGMSLFMAEVPKGIHLFHGRGDNNTVPGMEFLAYEIEHAASFAWSRDNRSPPPPPPGDKDRTLDSPPAHAPPGGPNAKPGWLQTYAPKRELRMLYIDGMSAGKTNAGTLDTQDCLLLNTSCDPSSCGGKGGGQGDFARLEKLCDLAWKEWDGRIDGFIRQEFGFELIVCRFNETLELVNQVKPWVDKKEGKGGRGGFRGTGPAGGVAAGASRYDGLGRSRARLDFATMFTVFNSDLELFSQGRLPRIVEPDVEVHKHLLRDVARLVESDIETWSIDWQSVSDSIVLRYAAHLEQLTTEHWPSIETLQDAVILRLYINFLDSSDPDTTAAVRRCANQFLPATTKRSVARHAVETVSNRICADLQSILEPTADLATAQGTLATLVDYLQWPAWKRCTGCAGTDICSIPMWPIGSREDYERPVCRNMTDAAQQHGYWEFDSHCRSGDSLLKHQSNVSQFVDDEL